jgi:hypothetical protein
MAQQKEARLSQRIATALRKRGALVIKIAGGMYQTPGLSDLFVIIGGMFHAIEVKRPRADGGPGCEKGLTEKQTLFLERVEEAGGISGCVESVEEAVEMIYGKDEK